MLRRYVIAYGVWLAAVLAMGGLALYWYKRVEDIGLRELADRLREEPAQAATKSDDGADA